LAYSYENTCSHSPFCSAFAPDTEYFGIHGAGVQGKEYLQFVSRTLKKIYLYDPHDDAVDAAIAEVQPEIDVEIVKATSPQEVAEK